MLILNTFKIITLKKYIHTNPLYRMLKSVRFIIEFIEFCLKFNFFQCIITFSLCKLKNKSMMKLLVISQQDGIIQKCMSCFGSKKTRKIEMR